MEPNILDWVLKEYGYEVVIEEKQNTYSNINLTKIELSNGKNNAVIVKAPRNRLTDALMAYEKENVDLHKMFGNGELFNGVYIIYDVDHTSNEDLIKAYNLHNDENDNGLLLVSSPCIEVLTDLNREQDLKIKKSFKEYKAERNTVLQSKYKCNCEEYIKNNFNEIVIYYLDKNYKELNETNIMNHPKFVIDKINKENYRSKTECTIRYFTTVLYVAIAHMKGLTKKIDNYKEVKEFFENKQ